MLAESLDQLGRTQLAADARTAIGSFVEAYEVAELNGLLAIEASARVGLADTYLALSAPDKALPQLERARTIYDEIDETRAEQVRHRLAALSSAATA